MSALSAFENALPAWRQMLAAEQVLNEQQAQERYGADTSGAKRHIAGALRPLSEEQVQHCVQVAHAHGVGLHPISTGNNWGYGTALPPRDGMVILDMSGMNRIIDFDAELGVVTVEPGVTQGMLHEFLTRGGHNYMVPTTGAGPDCSLMGNALQRGYGITPICDHWSAVTDLQAVRRDGSLYRSALSTLGSSELARLHRWGVGPYEQGLFSQGREGVVTSMSLLLAKRPPSIRMAVFNMNGDAQLAAVVPVVRSILASLPGLVGGINLMNQLRVLAMTAPYPEHLVGTDGVLPGPVIRDLGAQYRVPPWTGIATLYGEPAAVRAACGVFRQRLSALGIRPIFVDAGLARVAERLSGAMPGIWGRRMAARAQALAGALDLASGVPNRTALPLAYWRSGRKFDPSVSRDPAADGCGLLWYAPLVSMRSSSVKAAVSTITESMRQAGFEPLITLTTVSDRLFDATTPILFDARNADWARRAHGLLSALIDAGTGIGAHPYRRGTVGALQEPSSGGAALDR